MTVLSDATIEKLIHEETIKIDPYNSEQLQPASYDFLLHPTILVFENHTQPVIDPYNKPEDLHRAVVATEEKPFVLHPGEFILGSTVEVITLPDHVIARCEGKSSLGRIGLLIHATAGFVDPGFSGQITLELANVSRQPILLHPNMRIGQFSFEYLDSPARKPYGHPDLNSKYQNQQGPVGSRYHGNRR